MTRRIRIQHRFVSFTTRLFLEYATRQYQPPYSLWRKMLLPDSTVQLGIDRFRHTKKRVHTSKMVKLIIQSSVLLWLSLTAQSLAPKEEPESSEESSYKDAEFVYPAGILSERDIPVCANDPGELIACNIVHKRYFYPQKVERLCRCPDRSECPWKFAEYKVVQKSGETFKRLTDPYSTMLNSRAQFKFCNEITPLPKCIKSPQDASLRIVTVATNTQIKATCHCPAFKRWRLIDDDMKDFNNGTIQRTQSYLCDKLPRCKSREHCGLVRADTFATYFHCSCPKQHLCHPSDMSNSVNSSVELLYNGPAIKSYCLPH